MPASSQETDRSTIRSAGHDRRAGPILFFRGYQDGALSLVALLVLPDGDDPALLLANGETIPPHALSRIGGCTLWQYAFVLPSGRPASYDLGGQRYPVSTALDGDLRIAYVACNGQEEGDRERRPPERNALWLRLADQHADAPLHLLLHGGDQLYADEMLEVTEETRAWRRGEAVPAMSESRQTVVREEMRIYLLERYVELYTQQAPSRLMARVPSLCMWDDHDICDGWGSLPADHLDSPVGRLVFAVAREMFLIFQMGAAPNAPPAFCSDAPGDSLGWAVRLPGLGIVAPDLRSERRPDRVMGAKGWSTFRHGLASVADAHTLVLSSVPALGPRLSWVESAMRIWPHTQKYEDDLRDQWQSRAHRDEWAAFLRALLEVHEQDGQRVTVLSGEIHLATRGTLASAVGPLHQFVASGITHPAPPRSYARMLGGLARLGASPLDGHAIRMLPLPGQRAIYTTQRNYLMLVREGGRWGLWWELEENGATPTLSL